MPTYTLQNPYHGINAHLHSIAQNPEDDGPTLWTSFHTSHITHIVDTLNQQLPLNYIARTEQSLQIWTEPEEKPEDNPQPRTKRSPRPDASIFHTSVTDSTLTIAPDDTSIRIIEFDPFKELEITIPSVHIYEVRDHKMIGTPITRIELLSASNKWHGSGYYGYYVNRYTSIYSNTSLVELDYLHESKSPIPKIPRYPYSNDSHAYYIAVTDRRLGEREKKQFRVHVVDVDQPLPQQVLIPLAHTDSLLFDFDAVYQFTFKAGRWGTRIDYEKPPRNFDTYSPTDQERIRQVMQRAQQPEKAE
jgi:hypothetical protein